MNESRSASVLDILGMPQNLQRGCNAYYDSAHNQYKFEDVFKVEKNIVILYCKYSWHKWSHSLIILCLWSDGSTGGKQEDDERTIVEETKGY